MEMSEFEWFLKENHSFFMQFKQFITLAERFGANRSESTFLLSICDFFRRF